MSTITLFFHPFLVLLLPISVRVRGGGRDEVFVADTQAFSTDNRANFEQSGGGIFRKPLLALSHYQKFVFRILFRSTSPNSRSSERWRRRCSFGCWRSGVFDRKPSQSRTVWWRNFCHRCECQLTRDVLSCETLFLRTSTNTVVRRITFSVRRRAWHVGCLTPQTLPVDWGSSTWKWRAISWSRNVNVPQTDCQRFLTRLCAFPWWNVKV